MNYWKVYDKFTSNPYLTDFTETQLVTASGSEQSKVILDEVQELRDQGWKIIGQHALRDYSILEPAIDREGVRSVVVTYCYDGRKKSVVEAKTGVEVTTTAADTYVETAWLEQGEDDVWRVSMIGNEAQQC